MKLTRKRRRYYNTDRPQVLVLNKAYIPINVVDFEDSLTNWVNGRAKILHSYDDIRIRSGMNHKAERTVDILCPSVIVMTDCSPSDFDSCKVKTLPLNRKNIFDRDKGKCCYCNCDLDFETFTIEHVFPESRGGLNDWINVRASCYSCNNLKDDRTLIEMGWKLRRRVGIPTLTEEVPKNIIYHIGGRIPHESWRPYIYWEVKIKEKERENIKPIDIEAERIKYARRNI